MSRTEQPAGPAADATLRLTIDGRVITAHEGQSVAAALLEAGVRSWRSTRVRQRPRGLFCGIGVCYDCLLTIDGITDQRACLVPARDGMHLSTGSVTLPTTADAEQVRR